jgi:hypothetical protein
VTRITPGPTLHLVGSDQDFRRACAMAAGGGGERGQAHWILSPEPPTTDFPLPPHAEWVCLPGLHPGRITNQSGQMCRDFLSALVSTLSSNNLYMHEGFAGLWDDGAQQIVDGMAGVIQIECVGPDGGERDVPKDPAGS